jgi:hypothetical protein
MRRDRPVWLHVSSSWVIGIMSPHYHPDLNQIEQTNGREFSPRRQYQMGVSFSVVIARIVC